VIGLSVIEREILVSRGDAMLGTRDVISARLFYQRAADAGDNIAALRLGATFDPVFLNRVGLGPMGADLAKAAQWYRRARDLGNKDADTLLKTDLGLAGSF
jgi:TPR repeat protein